MLIVEKFCNPFVDQTIWRDSYPFGGRAFVTCLLSYLLYDKAVCRNAQAAAGLLNMWEWVHRVLNQGSNMFALTRMVHTW